jgi:hypothetical protein
MASSEKTTAGAAKARRFPRVRRVRPAVWRRPDGSEYLRIEVIGRGGAQLRSDVPIEPGTKMPLEICLAGGVIEAWARVVHCVEQDGAYAVGVELVDLGEDAEQLLARLIANGS